MGKELNDFSVQPNNKTETVDDIIEAVISSNQLQHDLQTVENFGEDEKDSNLKLFFGHENWNLMMNMLIGFRAGLKMLLYKDDLVDSDFHHVVRHDINKVTFTSALRTLASRRRSAERAALAVVPRRILSLTLSWRRTR